MTWRHKLDPTLKDHFEDLVKSAKNEEGAYKLSKTPSRAQLWTALSILSKKISDLELQVKSLEKSKPKKSNSKLKKSLKKM